MLRWYCSYSMFCSLHSITNEKQYKKLLAMNPVATENVGEKHDTARGKPYRAIANRHLALSAKRTGTQRRTKVSP